VTQLIESKQYEYGGKQRRTRWEYTYLCQCDCGKSKAVPRSGLLSGHTKSCGCRHRTYRAENPKWSGHGEISGQFWTRARRNAKLRDLDFKITIEEGWALFLTQKRKCALSGLVLRFGTPMSKSTASLDRIDSNHGYINKNVQWIHKSINKMKMDMKEARFIELCTAIINHQTTKKG